MTERKTTGLFLNCPTNSFKWGMAATHGAQCVAQNSNTMTLPFSFAQLTSSAGGPCSVLVNVSGGGASPIFGPSLSALAKELLMESATTSVAMRYLFDVFIDTESEVLAGCHGARLRLRVAGVKGDIRW